MFEKYFEYMDSRIIGQEELKLSMLIALIGNGHLLIEGNPGLAKTQSVKLLADLLDVSFSRIQGTPDLLPVDILGARAFDAQQKKYVDFLGPIFSNIVLVDEINRAPAKLQSAFFEAMAENQVTFAGEKKELPDFFHVFATMNTLSSLGTFELPEAQKDRFFLSTYVSYPSLGEEKEILKRQFTSKNSTEKIDIGNIKHHSQSASKIHVSDDIYESICQVIAHSREGKFSEYFDFPYSVRATKDLLKAAKIYAYLQEEDTVYPEHVKAVAQGVLRHRTALSYIGIKKYQNEAELISDILNNTKWLYEDKK